MGIPGKIYNRRSGGHTARRSRDAWLYRQTEFVASYNAGRLRIAPGKIINAGIKPGEDISHLHYFGFGPGNAKTYIVNGQKVKLSEAVRLLGYRDLSSLLHRIKKDKIPPGGDITHLRPTKKHMPGRVSRPRIFIINGQKVTISQAARQPGYKTNSGLNHRIRKPEIPDGRDISHPVKPKRSKN